MIFETAAAAKLRKGYLKTNEVSFCAAKTNEVSFNFVEAHAFRQPLLMGYLNGSLPKTKLKSSLHIGLF